jgi:hypothetical protein
MKKKDINMGIIKNAFAYGVLTILNEGSTMWNGQPNTHRLVKEIERQRYKNGKLDPTIANDGCDSLEYGLVPYYINCYNISFPIRKLNYQKSAHYDDIKKMAGYDNFSYELYIVGDTKISEDAFRDNDSLTKVYIYSKAGEISDYAFYRCTNLREAVLGSGVEVINSLSFAECKSLKDISFSEGLKEIKGSAFAGCTSLLYVTIPASAKDGVSENVFPNYTEIEYK